jgi:hypothetical protein
MTDILLILTLWGVPWLIYKVLSDFDQRVSERMTIKQDIAELATSVWVLSQKLDTIHDLLTKKKIRTPPKIMPFPLQSEQINPSNESEA